MEHQHASPAPPPPSYGPFVSSCKAFGISKSYAYELVKEGLLEPFHLGRKAFIYFDQLHSLPQRVAAKESN